ncbi:hypothetical protein WKV44_03445 [Spirochaetia bacterium 38H-sp]|uniref:Uncharacterized protein n=1 Tax=Rarispira pelagica TaxID=3141764 RepID=A0ABU9UA99_9SPIR
MKFRKKISWVTLLIALGLLVYSIYHFVVGLVLWASVKLLIAVGLIISALWDDRRATVLMGHLIIVAGAFLFTAGIYLAPYIQKRVMETGEVSILDIITFPLFWGIFAMGGGVCAIYHGFCRCVRHEWKIKAE